MTVSLTNRLGLHRWSASTDPWSHVDFDSDNAQLEALAVIGVDGTLAARPVAGVDRRLYLATDVHRTFLDDGTSWRELADLAVANTWTTQQTFAGVVVNGGITAADGSVEVGSALALAGNVGFYGTAPAAKPGATTDLKAGLAGLGLITAGGATPLNLEGGSLTAAAGTFSGALTTSGAFGANGAAAKARAGATDEIKAALAGFGLLTDGGATPLDLDGGTLSAGAANLSGNLAVTGTTTLTGALTANNGLTLADAKDLTIGTGTGTKIGQAASKIGFFGTTPAAKPGLYNLTGAADRTLGAYTSNQQTAAYSGAADGEAKLADLNALRVAYENLRVYLEDLAGLVIATGTDLKTLGLVS